MKTNLLYEVFVLAVLIQSRDLVFNLAGGLSFKSNYVVNRCFPCKPTFLDKVKNSWGLISLSNVPCKACGKVVTSEAKGVGSKDGSGITQDGATALINKGLCDACKESKAQGAAGAN
jgi:hypothetical protein